ncbi:hypothetical protein D3C75_1293880 [compost metagenome]
MIIAGLTGCMGAAIVTRFTANMMGAMIVAGFRVVAAAARVAVAGGGIAGMAVAMVAAAVPRPAAT